MIRFAGKLLLILAAVSFGLAGSALAEIRQYSMTLTPMVGYQLIDGGLDLDSDASVGLAAGYNLSKHWALEADVRYTPTETDYKQNSLNQDVDVWTLGGSVLYHFQPDQALNPYLAIGGGGIIYDNDKSSNDKDYMGYYGGGLKYFFSETTALRLDLRHIINAKTDKEFSRDNDKKWRHHLSAMVGLAFQFGGVSGTPVQKMRQAEPLVRQAEPLVETKPTPADSDRDGVLDPHDRCPDTAPGVRVDKQGCPKDSDGDGVADYKDACLDTPRGADVDERGCPKVVEPIATLALHLNFGVDKDTVTPFHYRELDKANAFIQEYPGHKVVVEGHTDSSGDAAYNQELSMRRAESVRQALIDRYGIAADRISAQGFGEDQPVAGNDTADGRQQNRRVEIEILP